MPFTYLNTDYATGPTGNEKIDKSWQTLKNLTGWDYRVAMMHEVSGMLWWKKRTQVFTIFVPCGVTDYGGEFGIEDMNGRMLFHAPEPIALAFIEALYWGALDERQRNAQGNNLLLQQSTYRLQELHRLEEVMKECKFLLRKMWPYYWGPNCGELREKARLNVGGE